jgi:hypothetical protein
VAEIDVELYAEQVVQNQHEPPRILHLHVLLGVIFDRGSIWVMLFGLATILAGFGYLIMPVDDPSGRGLGVIVAFISGGLIAISPWIYMWKWYLALRYGRLASATIIELHKEGPGSQATFRAARNGAAKGRWSITTERGTFTESFTLDQAWVADLWVGSQVRVLVHPRKQKVLMPVGP